MVLERHIVYSLSEENMAAYFYIMQCTQSSNEAIQVPIRDTIEKSVPAAVILVEKYCLLLFSNEFEVMGFWINILTFFVFAYSLNLYSILRQKRRIASS